MTKAKLHPRPVHWTRIDPDGASETLRVVRLDDGGQRCVQITTGPELGDDFVGLYDFDGDQIPLGNATWTAVRATAAEVRRIERDWETGLSVVERVEVAS